MKIDQVRLKGFRNHQDTQMVLDKINFIVGPNNAGKSSILGGAEFGFTGKCQWTDRAGRGSGELVCQGATEASVVLEVAGLGTILRSLPDHKLRVGNKTGTLAQATIYNALGCEEDRLRVACNTGSFLSLNSAEQKDFLFNAFGLTFSADCVAPRLAQWFREAGLPEDKAEGLAARGKAYYPAGLSGGPEVLEVMEKKARDYRKEVRRDHKRLSAALAEMEVPTVKMPRVEELKEQLRVLRQQRDEYLQQRGGTGQDRRQALQKQLETTGEKLAVAREKAGQITEQSKRLQSSAALVETLSQQAGELQDRIRLVGGQAAALEVELSEVQAWRDNLVQAVEVLAGEERRCPLAPEHIRCGLTDGQLTEIVHSLQTTTQAAEQDLERIGLRQQKTQQALDRSQSDLRQLQAQQAAAQEQYRQYLLLQSHLNTQQTLINQLNTEKATLQRELAELPQPESDFADLALQVAKLDQQLGVAEQELVVAGEQLALAKRRAELEQEINALAEELADLELLVKALGPEGLKKDLLAGLLEQFLGRANDRLHRLTKGAYQLKLGPDSTLLCQQSSGVLLPLKLLSRSEQLRVGIALQEALSHAAGLRFLAIDEADMLDQENRDLLSHTLLELAEEYEQVLVFTTVGDTTPVNPGIPGVKVFWVEAGKVSEL